MRVKCLFFATYRDVAGAAELELELPENSTVSALVRHLRAQFATSSLPTSPVVAVNQVYASLDTVLGDGDEVAFIPPVAGG